MKQAAEVAVVVKQEVAAAVAVKQAAEVVVAVKQEVAVVVLSRSILATRFRRNLWKKDSRRLRSPQNQT